MADEPLRLERDVEVRVHLQWIETQIKQAYEDGTRRVPFHETAGAAELQKIRGALNGGKLKVPVPREEP